MPFRGESNGLGSLASWLLACTNTSSILERLASGLDALAADFDRLIIEAPLGCAGREVVASRHAAQMTSRVGSRSHRALFFEVFIGVGVEQLSHGYIMTRGCDNLD